MRTVQAKKEALEMKLAEKEKQLEQQLQKIKDAAIFELKRIEKNKKQ